MLKEVGASGEISLGKRLAKRLFEVVFHGDGRIELLPVRVVGAVSALPVAPEVSKERAEWLPPGGYATASQWAVSNREALEAYAERISAQGTAAEQLQQYLTGTPGHDEGAAG